MLKRLWLAFLLCFLPISSFAQNALTTGSETLLANLKTIAVSSGFSGDANGNATAAIQYRASGSMTWLTAHPPFIDRRATFPTVPSGTTANPRVNEARTKIYGLTPNTLYEVQTVWSDPIDGVIGTNPVLQTITTVTYTPPTGSGTPRTVTNDSTMASILGVGGSANPGDVVTIQAGTYVGATIARGGNSGAFLKIVCDPGVTISSAAGSGISISSGADFIVFGDRSNNDCVLGSTWTNGVAINGVHQYIYIQGFNMMNSVAGCASGASGSGVSIGDGSHHIFVLNNIINSIALLNPASPCTQVPANVSPGTTIGVGGNYTNIVIEGNSWAGGWRDGIAASNSLQALEQVDINGNSAVEVKDDISDTKGQNINVSVFQNSFVQNKGFTCIAANTNLVANVKLIGPMWIIGNTCKVSTGAAVGGTVFKIGGVPTFLYNNSLDNTGMGTTSAGWEGINQAGAVGTTLTSRNNAVLSGRAGISGWAPGTTFDYDALITTAPSGNNWVRSYNGVNYQSLAAFKACPTPCQEPSGILGTTGMFLNNTTFAIDASSPLYNTGVSIPNINTADGLLPASGAGPDIGAFEFSTDFPVPGNNGLLTVSGIGSSGATINWTAATGTHPPFDYLVCQSTLNNISTVAACKAASVQGYMTGITSYMASASPLSSTWNNVVVRDANRNEVAYDAVNFTTTCGASQLVFTAQPSSVILGASVGTVTVAIKNVFGTVCTDSSATITFAKAAGATWGTLNSATGLSFAVTAGVGTRTNMNVTGATGSGSIKVSSSGLTDGVSNSITISPNTPVGVGAIRLFAR